VISLFSQSQAVVSGLAEAELVLGCQGGWSWADAAKLDFDLDVPSINMDLNLFLCMIKFSADLYEPGFPVWVSGKNAYATCPKIFPASFTVINK
jgi:hypothetical protein